MKILVCVKRVPAPGARIVLTEDQRSIDSTLLSFTVSPHEECAVEEAVRIAEATTGSVTVLTLGPVESEEQLRSAVAVGVGEAVLIPTDGEDWDPMSTASAIASTVEDLEGEGRFDLILFGNESADSGGYQVGVRVAHALGRPTVTGIKGIEVEQGTVRLRRDTATGSELYRLPLPAVVSVREGINLPRYPTLKGRLEAKKAEVRVVEKERVGSGQTMLRLVSPSQVASETTILPDAAAVVDLLEQLQVVR
jgi:electron transfer flavoprotein beta subunit